MKLEMLADERFTRLKQAIAIIEASEGEYTKEVHKNFDALDMKAIEQLARKRRAKLLLKKKLEWFIEKYGQK